VDLFYSRDTGLQEIGTMTAVRRFDLTPRFAEHGSPVPARHGGVAHRHRSSRIDRPPGGLRGPGDGVLGTKWGSRARELSCRLAESPAAEEPLRLLAAALPSPPDNPDAVQRAIGAMTAAHGAVDLEWVARQANLSPPQFRRRCLDTSGLAPNRRGWRPLRRKPQDLVYFFYRLLRDQCELAQVVIIERALSIGGLI